MSINVVLIDVPLIPSFPSYLEQSCAPSHSGRIPFDLDLHFALTYVASEPERVGGRYLRQTILNQIKAQRLFCEKKKKKKEGK